MTTFDPDDTGEVAPPTVERRAGDPLTQHRDDKVLAAIDAGDQTVRAMAVRWNRCTRHHRNEIRKHLVLMERRGLVYMTGDARTPRERWHRRGRKPGETDAEIDPVA